MVIDMGFLQGLIADVGGDREFVADLLDQFVTNVASRLAAIAAAPTGPALRDAVHALGSPAASLGLADLARHCRGIEAAIEAGADLTADQVHEQVAQSAAGTVAAIESAGFSGPNR
ncbi:MAG: Hpt domain-containing protein [Candidatus Nanopelagicales bacterium]